MILPLMKNNLNDHGFCNLQLFLLMVVLNVSCTNSPRNKGNNDGKVIEKNTVLQKPPSSFSDTLTIDTPAAVFYSPDSLQLEKIRSATDAKIFDANMHEFYFLIKNAHTAIKKNTPQLKIIEAKNVRYLVFAKTDKTKDCIDLNTKYDAYGLFAFNRKDPPRLFDMANIDSELGFYFSKKK